MKNMQGKQIPQVTFRARNDEGWVDISSESLFSGKKVVVFALPGAFTPTCSATHLPRYEELAPVFKSEGIDDVLCIAVNDGFIMQAWGKDQGVQNVKLIPDGNGAFSEAMGMLVEKQDLGFGHRSWRYSMLVNDGVVEKMFIEEEVAGDPFEVSDADTMLNYINAKATVPEPVAVISRAGCPHCQRAKALLEEKGIRYNEIEVGRDIDQASLRGLSGSITVPQVFIGGKLVGGADELTDYFKAA